MYIKRSKENTRALDAPQMHHFCKQFASRLKFAECKNQEVSVEERAALLPLQMLRFLFKNHIGVLPFEVEDTTGE
jgi:hypothetical protein